MCVSFCIEYCMFCHILRSGFDSEKVKNNWSGVVLLKFLDLTRLGGIEAAYLTFTTIQHQDKQTVWAIYKWFYESYIYDLI